jgi:hypothetical protein
LLILALCALLAIQAAVIPEEKSNDRQKRTLGLLTVGAQMAQSGVGTAGKVALTALGLVSAIKPLILLGIGKCKSCFAKECYANRSASSATLLGEPYATLSATLLGALRPTLLGVLRYSESIYCKKF